MAQIGATNQYTSTEAVRAALGVDAVDLKDQQILDAGLDVELGLDLAQWMPNFGLKLGISPSSTEEQKTLRAALQSYCKWFCAAEYASKPLAHLQLYSDGKAEQRRFSNLDWEALIAHCLGKCRTFKAMAIALDLEATAAAPQFTASIMSSAPPVYDPVTNEGAV